jgi:radical SAM superfamily enzyme YgiQ (UPF0313 family)
VNILLANSYFLERDANEQKIMKPYPPLGLLCIAAVLKEAGHSVEIFDGTFSRYADFQARLAGDRPDLVGIYTNVITRDVAVEMGREAVARRLPVVYGGPDATGDPEEYLATGAIAAVRGEGERTVVELCAHLEAAGPQADLRAIPGLILPDGGAVHRTPDRDRIDDLDALPLPDRGAIDMQRYVDAWRGRHGYSSLHLITSRGCPYHCTWCSKEIFGDQVRQRSPESVLAEIRMLKEAYDPEQLWMADDILTLNQKWIARWAAGMVEQGLVTPFECLSRVDRVSEETVRDLRRAGCYRVWYGAESGAEHVVASMRKGFTIDTVRESVRITKAAGIEVGLFILMGYPGEKMRDLLKTMSMIRDLAPHYCGGSVAFPIKGTQFYDEVRHQLAPDYAWSRRNENRLSFRGRYPAIFYWFAVRLLHNWSSFWSSRGHPAPHRAAADGAGNTGGAGNGGGDSAPEPAQLFTSQRAGGGLERLVKAAKFMVAGTGVIVIGLVYDLKQKLFPDRGALAGGTAPPGKPTGAVDGAA